MKDNYKLIMIPFNEKAQRILFPSITEEQALKHYKHAIVSLTLHENGGGYLQLFENEGKYPIKAERVGYDRFEWHDPCEKENSEEE